MEHFEIKKELLKHGILFAYFFPYRKNMVSELEIFFAIEIKKLACATSKKFRLIESFPAWKTDFKFPFDTKITLQMLLRNFTLKYISYIRWNIQWNGCLV